MTLRTTGDLNLNVSTTGYQIGGNNIPWHNGNTADIFVGVSAGNATMTGHNNTAVGNSAFHSNTAGIDNVAVGYEAGYGRPSSYGTFVGFGAGSGAITGTYNTFVGYIAGSATTSGVGNTFVGLDAGYTNIISSNNTGIGLQVLGLSTAGNNTGCGYKAGYTNTTGTSNTYLGYQADGATNALSNSYAIGNSASVCASDEMVFGNSSVTRWGFGVCPASGHAIEVGTSTSNGNGAYLTSGGAWTGASSRAKKEDFQKQDINVMLDKVRQMEVTKWKYKGTENEYHYGPMAEDFYQLFNVGDGKSISDMDKTGVLFLAVQALDASNRELKAKLTALQDQVNGCCNTQQGNSSDGARATAVDVALSSNSIVLDQNQPNPFKEQTTISYFIPDDSKDVKIIFTDSKGTVLREVEITQTGKGQLNVFAQDLSSGVYTYSIVANGITIDSKKMVCTK